MKATRTKKVTLTIPQQLYDALQAAGDPFGIGVQGMLIRLAEREALRQWEQANKRPVGRPRKVPTPEEVARAILREEQAAADRQVEQEEEQRRKAEQEKFAYMYVPKPS
jgi:hypothetical protein